jgi:hypothetical protein
MRHGYIAKTAKKAGISPNLLYGYLKGSFSAKPAAARRLAEVTKTDAMLWMQGGDPVERVAALERLAAGEDAGVALFIVRTQASLAL